MTIIRKEHRNRRQVREKARALEDDDFYSYLSTLRKNGIKFHEVMWPEHTRQKYISMADLQ